MQPADRLEFLRTVAPFAGLPPEVLTEVAGLLEEVYHAQESFIYQQDVTKMRGLDILVAGSYEAFFYDSQHLKRTPEIVEPSQCYGGVSLLLNKKRSLRTVLARVNLAPAPGPPEPQRWRAIVLGPAAGARVRVLGRR